MQLPPVSDADAAPARELQVQLETRITTQRLHYRSGQEETAAVSVYKIFDGTRGLLARHPQAHAFERAGLFLLNSVLRPYTARWHGWMDKDVFRNDLARRMFRYELLVLQTRLNAFVDLLKALQGGPGATPAAQEQFQKVQELTPAPIRQANLGGPLPASIGHEVTFRHGTLYNGKKFARPREINQAERAFIHKRRAVRDNTHPPQPDPATGRLPPVMDVTGLCLSGGGIRSATFCLGVVQTLARQGMLSQLDYLSTVSGGGYLGTFLTSFLGTPPESTAAESKEFPEEKPNAEATAPKGNAIDDTISKTFAPMQGRESAALRHLRNNSRYLLNGGIWGRAKIFGLLITGILTNILLIVPVPLLAALAVFGLKSAGFYDPLRVRNWTVSSVALGAFCGIAAILALVWLLLPLVRNFARGEKPGSKPVEFKHFWETAALSLSIGALAAGALLLVPVLFGFVRNIGIWINSFGPYLEKIMKSLPILTALAPVVFGLLTARLKSDGKMKKLAAILFTLSGPLFYLVTFIWAGSKLWSGAWDWIVVGSATGLALLWGWLWVDLNDFSPHGYYRERLCECYLAVPTPGDPTSLWRQMKRAVIHGRRKMQTVVGVRRQLPLSQINESGVAPYHLVNAAANLPSSREPNLRGRDCDFFVFTRDYCGGPVCGYIPTGLLEELDPHVDLGSAMAISGAAASSNMGVKTMRQYRFILTLLNFRLGYWLRNPLAGLRGPFNTPGPRYLFREMAGWMHERSGYINLSDGGHIENLALYELLRRRCKFIVVVDAGMEPKMECADLRLAQRYAQIDFGVQFDLDVGELALDPNRHSRAYGVFGKVQYKPRYENDPAGTGWIVYIKLAMTGGEPGYVADYRRQFPDFPHQTTADQIYDEAQFEAYRRLGEISAESLFRGELVDVTTNPGADDLSKPRFETVRGWFQAMANNLLPDNDLAFESNQTKNQ